MLKRFLSPKIDKFVNIGFPLLILRVGAGAFMLTHGWGKLMKAFSGDFSFGDPIGMGPATSLVLAAFAEGICSMFVIIGFGTRLATIPLIFTMSVAVFIVHADDPFGTKEKALMFLVIFVFLFFTGPGKYSLDKKLFDR